MRRLLLVGIRHSLQCGREPFVETDVDAFRDFVREVFHNHDLRLIAEEMSADGLANYGATETILSALGPELAIPVEFVDLDEAVRDRLKISSVRLRRAARLPGNVEPNRELFSLFEKHLTDPVRECAWLAHLLGRNLWPVLLIVGRDHVDSVAHRAKAIGIDVEVLEYER